MLINPIQWLNGRQQRGWNGTRYVPPLNLAYVAALTPPHWQVRIVDENTGRDARREVDYRPDLVGISSYTATIPRAYALAAHFGEQGIPVVIGGSHASAMPHEVGRHASAAFIGQAEGAWPRLIADLERGQLEAVYDGGTPPLEHLPLPRRDLYPQRYYFDAVLTSKGCPYRCEFCSVWKMSNGRYQMRPVEEVLDELAQIRARHLFFVDDNLAIDAGRTMRLCQGMVERGLKKRFAIQTSLEIGQNEELLAWLRRAGCFMIFVGIESLDTETLHRVRKASNLRVGVDNYEEIIARIQAQGMAVSAGIIFGNDGDTLETFRELAAFVAASGIDSPVYTILTPLPGTDLWQRLEAEGRLRLGHLPEDYGRFDAHHVTFEPLQVSASELLAANRQAVRAYTSTRAQAGGLWRTWRRTGSPLAALASVQNNRWARNNTQGE